MKIRENGLGQIHALQNGELVKLYRCEDCGKLCADVHDCTPDLMAAGATIASSKGTYCLDCSLEYAIRFIYHPFEGPDVFCWAFKENTHGVGL